MAKKLKDELQVTQNKRTRFCLKLKCKGSISNEHFQKLNWILSKSKVQTMYPLYSNRPAYVNEVFRSAETIRINTRNITIPFEKPVHDKTACLTSGLLFGIKFQKF